MLPVLSCLVVTGAAMWVAFRSHCKMSGMVFPVFKVKVCASCGLPRDMLAFATTSSRRCMACTPLLTAPKPKKAGRQRLWKAQLARINAELKKCGILKPATGCQAKELLGVDTPDALWAHMVPKLQANMSEENYGGSWHCDHAQPVAAFDLTQPCHRQRCFHVSNLQPMWASENLGKSSRMPSSDIACCPSPVTKPPPTVCPAQLNQKFAGQDRTCDVALSDWVKLK